MMHIFLIALLSVSSVVQGGTFNLTLNHSSHVVLDSCMYFEKTLTSEANLPPGVYKIYVTHECLGIKKIKIYENSTVKTLEIDVKPAKDPDKDLVKMDKEILELKKEVKALKKNNTYLKSLVDALNSMSVNLYSRLKSLRNENLNLSKQVETLEKEAKNCSLNVENMQLTIRNLRNKLKSLEIENSRLKSELNDLKATFGNAATYLEAFRSMFFFTLAFLVGAYFALIRR